MSTQVSQDNSLPMVEQTPRKKIRRNNSINRLVDAIAGIATQQQPQAATMLKPVSTNALIFDGKKNEKFELFEDIFHTMLKMQPKMTEAIKINHFYAHLRKEALRTFRNISASNKKSLEDVLIAFRQK